MTSVARSLTYVLTLLDTWTLRASMLMFVTILIIAFVSIVMRYIAEMPFVWEHEVVSFMMAWGVFLAMGTVTRANAHIRVNFFALKLFGERLGKQVYTLLENVIGFCVCSYLGYVGMRWLLWTARLNQRGMGDLDYPMWIPRMAIVIGMSLMVIFYTERLTRQVIGWRTGISQEMGTVFVMPEDQEPDKPKGSPEDQKLSEQTQSSEQTGEGKGS